MAKAIVQHHVVDYDGWFGVFSDHEATRRKHGATGHVVYRSVADPNTLVVVTDFASAQGAQAFSQDPSLRAAMEKGGVDGTPQFWLVEEADAQSY